MLDESDYSDGFLTDEERERIIKEIEAKRENATTDDTNDAVGPGYIESLRKEIARLEKKRSEVTDEMNDALEELDDAGPGYKRYLKSKLATLQRQAYNLSTEISEKYSELQKIESARKGTKR